MTSSNSEVTEDGDRTESTTSIEVERQLVFSIDGDLNVEDEPAETTLEDHGVDVDHRHLESRIDTPSSDSFIDDRESTRGTVGDPGEQVTLFADTAPDQVTLDGTDAASQFLFEPSAEDDC